MKEIRPNATVRIFKRSKTGNWRHKGKILSKRQEPRSYNVLNDKGNVVRRNRIHLLPTNEAFDEEYSPSDVYTDDESESVNETAADDSIIVDNPVVHPNGDYVTRF